MPPNTSVVQNNHNSFDESFSQLVEDTPFLDIEVPHSALFEGALKVVQSVFTSWQEQDIQFVQCKDGITNQCKFNAQPSCR
jgi:ethanolamine kinase